MSVLTELLTQTLAYIVTMLIGLLIIGFLQRGFFIPFTRVKTSFGKFVLVKLKGIDKDTYKVGRVEENFLIYKTKTGKKRIPLNDSAVFYRSLGCTWVDFNEATSDFNKPDFSKINTYDAEKVDSLLERAIFRPSANDRNMQIIMVLIVVAVIVAGASVYFGYLNHQDALFIKEQLAGLNKGFAVAK